MCVAICAFLIPYGESGRSWINDPPLFRAVDVAILYIYPCVHSPFSLGARRDEIPPVSCQLGKRSFRGLWSLWRQHVMIGCKKSICSMITILQNDYLSMLRSCCVTM